ncbi:MAG: hypothetical protein ACM3ZV_02885 [Bacillota bacterium]
MLELLFLSTVLTVAPASARHRADSDGPSCPYERARVATALSMGEKAAARIPIRVTLLEGRASDSSLRSRLASRFLTP